MKSLLVMIGVAVIALIGMAAIPMKVSIEPIVTHLHHPMPHRNDLQVTGGTPVAYGSDKLLESNDNGAFAVIWESSPGKFVWTYDMDEYLYILEGHAILRGYGEPKTIKAGDLVLFKAGSVVEWEVTQTIRKIAFLRYNSYAGTWLARINHRIERKLLRLMGKLGP